MKNRLHTTCQLADGFHWVLVDPDGWISASSPLGFVTEDDALADWEVRKHYC